MSKTKLLQSVDSDIETHTKKRYFSCLSSWQIHLICAFFFFNQFENLIQIFDPALRVTVCLIDWLDIGIKINYLLIFSGRGKLQRRTRGGWVTWQKLYLRQPIISLLKWQMSLTRVGHLHLFTCHTRDCVMSVQLLREFNQCKLLWFGREGRITVLL